MSCKQSPRTAKVKQKYEELQNEVIRLTELSQNQAREIQILNDALETNLKDSDVNENLLYELSSLRVDVRKLSEANRSKDSVISKLEKEVVDLEQEKATLIGEINRAAKELSRLRSIENSLSKEKKELLEDLNESKNEFQSANIRLSMLQEKYNELSYTNENLEQQISEYKQEKNQLQQLKSELSQRISFLTAENDSLNSQLDVFSKMNFENQQAIVESSIQISELKNVIALLKKPSTLDDSIIRNNMK